MARAIAVACLAITASLSPAAVVGAGNVPGTNNDSGPNFMAISQVTQLLTAGTYSALTFNYQFTEAQTTIGGSVRPMLLVSPSSNVYTVIALGDLLTYAGVTSFTSTPFGGSNSFTLAADTNVYAGFFWEQDTGITQRVPIAFTGSGSPGTYIRYGGTVAAPVLNTNVSGGLGSGLFGSRRYDFSVTISDPPPAVPEPATWMMGAACLAGILLRRRRRAPRA